MNILRVVLGLCAGVDRYDTSQRDWLHNRNSGGLRVTRALVLPALLPHGPVEHDAYLDWQSTDSMFSFCPVPGEVA